MGNSNSKDFIGGFLINLEKPYYYPGEIVHGNIYILFNKEYETNSIEIQLKVEEYVGFKERKKRKNKPEETYLKSRNSKKTIYNNTQILLQPLDNLIVPGHYILPFTFMLPLSLPGSFEYYDNQYTAYIKYIIEVRTIPNEISHKSIKNSILFIVRQPPQFFQYKSKLSDTKTIKMCCFNKGSSSISINLERNYYCIDDKVCIICEIDNTRCCLNLKNLKIEFFQEITLKDKKERTRKLIRKVSDYEIQCNNRGTENTRTIELRLRDSNNPTNFYKEKCEHTYLFKDINLIPLLQASVSSQYITCHYYLKINTVFDTFCGTSATPSIEIPIIIYIPDIRCNIQLYQPHNWNPQLMNIIDVNFPSFEESKIFKKQITMIDNISNGGDHYCHISDIYDRPKKQYSSLNLYKNVSKENLTKQYSSDNITNSDRSNIKSGNEIKDFDDTNTDNKNESLLKLEKNN